MRYVFSIMLILIVFGSAGAFGDYELKEPFEERMPAGDVNLVAVSTRNGSITVSVWDQDEVYVKAEKKVKAPDEETARQYEEELKIEIRSAGDVLEIRTVRPHWSSKSGRGFWRRLFGGGFTDIQSSVSYEIQVPRRVGLKLDTRNGGIRAGGTEGDLRAYSRNGDLRFQEIGGRVDAETRNGLIEVSDVGGELHAKSRNGDIRAEEIAGIVQNVHTRNGGIRLVNIGGARKVVTRNGEIRLVNVGGVRKVVTRNGEIYVDISRSDLDDGYFETRNSDITVIVPDEISATINAETRSGRIKTDFPITIQEQTERGKVYGRIGSGGPVLKFRTRNGAIRIESR